VVCLGACVLAGCGGSGGGTQTAGASGQTLKVTLTDGGCSRSSLTAKSGPVTFVVSNEGSAKVTEFELLGDDGTILGERENVVPGLGGSFSLRLGPGRYTMSCPNGDGEDGVLVVGGKPVASANGAGARELATATAGYHAYVVAETAALLDGTRRFVAALRRGDLARARELYGPVRYHYEAIEPVAESFGDLDPEIDARAGDVPVGHWTGFHRIEMILWQTGTTRGTAALGTKLLTDVKELQRKARTLEFQPAQLANGAVELLNEVAGSKITGEEDRYSHTDLSDFAGNLAGAWRAFELLRPALVQAGDAQLAAAISDRFAAVDEGLDGYRRSTPLGFAPYGELTPADRKALAQKIDALAEPLSTVAARVSR
jgi:iron uptake system component EfeO